MRELLKTGLATTAVFAALTLTTVGSRVWAGQAKQKSTKDQKAEQKAKTDSLTGCVDEQEGRYVLVEDRNMHAVAALEADGFPTEGFAKHVGHKVTIRGTSSPGGALLLFKVRSIETVSDTCAPQP